MSSFDPRDSTTSLPFTFSTVVALLRVLWEGPPVPRVPFLCGHSALKASSYCPRVLIHWSLPWRHLRPPVSSPSWNNWWPLPLSLQRRGAWKGLCVDVTPFSVENLMKKTTTTTTTSRLRQVARTLVNFYCAFSGRHAVAW